ncbi:hypothetical protein RQN30_11730 [Arcanobacterium hippocoleae]
MKYQAVLNLLIAFAVGQIEEMLLNQGVIGQRRQSELIEYFTIRHIGYAGVGWRYD